MELPGASVSFLYAPIDGVAAYWLSLRKLLGNARNVKALETENAFVAEPFARHLLDMLVMQVAPERFRHLAEICGASEIDRLDRQFDLMRVAIMDMATGDVIGFLHADDILCNYSTVSKIMDIFEKKQVDAVYGDLVYVARNDVYNIVRFWKSSDFTPQLLKQGWMPPHPTLFVVKSIYEKYGKFNPELRIAADYDLILRFFSQPDFKSEYLPHIIIRMRMGGISNRNIGNILRKSQEDYKSMKFNNVGGIWALLRKNFSKIPQLKPFQKMKRHG